MARSQPTTPNGGGSVASQQAVTPTASPSALSVPAFRSLSAKEQRYVLRAAASELIEREQFAIRHGLTFNGSRDLYTALGYAQKISLKDYRERYERGGIAESIVEAYPRAIWSDGASIIENPDPDIETPFELAVVELFDRLDVWARLMRADILAGLGRYAVLLIGVEGVESAQSLAQPLPKLTTPNPDAVLTLTPLPEERAKIDKFVKSPSDVRFGLPEAYQIKLSDDLTAKVHWTRCIHIAQGLLVNDVYGKPCLRPVWNYLDDLDKIVGGGSEAAWKRMDPGIQLEMDPAITNDLTDEELVAEQTKISEQFDEYRHGSGRFLYTSGVKMNPLTTPVTAFGINADAIIQLIAGTKRIPKRIFVGSERGELASSQDDDNWNDQADTNRTEHGTPVTRDFVTRLIDFGYLPKPKGVDAKSRKFDVIWPSRDELSEVEKIEVVGKIAAANKAQHDAKGGLLMTNNEIRLTFLDLGPAEDVSETDDTESDEPDVDSDALDDTDDDADADGIEDEEIRAAESDPASRRIVLIGGPRRGKSTIARAYREQGIPTFCSDPASMVKEPEDGVTYLPDGLAWSESSQYVADNWLSQPAPWCVEGIATARALRKVIAAGKLDSLSGIEVVVLDSAHESATVTPAQERAAKGVMTVWNGIAQHFPQAWHLRSKVVASKQPASLPSPSLRRLRAAKVQLQAQASVQRKRMSVRTI